MSAGIQPTTPSKIMVWIGRAISALPALMLIYSASMKFHLNEENTAGTIQMGWDPKIMLYLGIVELSCAVLYAIPQTAVLGAILMTGYLGGAVATHVRIADYGHAPIAFVFGILVWLGLYLRDARIRDLAPLRKL
jgi:hypothetical protein